MFRSLAITILTLSLAMPAIAEPVQKEELGDLIRQYLNDNPEVIMEAVDRYQQKAKEAGLAKVREAIKANADAIFNDPNDGTIGDKDAKVTIVEFFDYNCSACKYMFKPIDTLYKAGLKDVRVVFKEYPIFGERSEKLAKIGLAVNALAPEKYYEFHGLMMQHKGAITAEDAYGYAGQVGVEREAIQKELSDAKYTQMLKDGAALGDKLQIRGTPFLIVGNEPVPHALDKAALDNYIAKARAAKQ